MNSILMSGSIEGSFCEDSLFTIFFFFTSGAEASIETNLHNNPEGGVTRAVSICNPCSVDKDQPQPLCAVQPPTMEACTVYELSQSFTSIKNQESLKTSTAHTEPDGDGKNTNRWCIPS